MRILGTRPIGHPPGAGGWSPLLGRLLAAGALGVAALVALAHSLAPAAAAVPAAAGAAAAATAEIAIDDFAFDPPVITVAAGTRVVWTNRDGSPHTVVSSGDPRVLRSPPLDTGDAFGFTFAAPGRYRYFCSLHPHMQGTVVVQ